MLALGVQGLYMYLLLACCSTIQIVLALLLGLLSHIPGHRLLLPCLCILSFLLLLLHSMKSSVGTSRE